MKIFGMKEMQDTGSFIAVYKPSEIILVIFKIHLKFTENAYNPLAVCIRRHILCIYKSSNMPVGVYVGGEEGWEY